MEASSVWQVFPEKTVSEDSMNQEGALRADARRNRERILAAAEAVFLEQGAGAALEDVAKRAGVGIGTLYRRFPTREALLAATYNARFLSLAAASRARDDGRDPAGALRAYLEDLVTGTTLYRGFATAIGTVLQSGTPGCHATTEEGERLLRQAQASGAVRPDVRFQDLVCVVTAISLALEQEGALEQGRTPEQEGASPPRVRHLTDLFLDGIGRR
jgi:AcrR family transcriptional regulator